MIIKNIIIVCLLLACFIPFNVSSASIDISEYVELVEFSSDITNFHLKFKVDSSLVKDYVGNIATKDLSYNYIGKGYTNFTSRLRDISYIVEEIKGEYFITIDIDVYASTDGFQLDIIPRIKSLTVNKFSWWNNTYLKRMDLWVDGANQVTGALTNFPVYVYFNANSSLNTHAQANGHDIVFVDTTNTTEFYAEKVYYSAGTLHAWVNITSIASGSNTHFNMYYSNSGVAPKTLAFQQSAWDTNFFNAVYHLYDLTTSTVNDSTSYNRDNNKRGADEPNEATGHIYKSQDFDGANDFIGQIDSDVMFPNDNSWAISLWFEPDSQTNQDRFWTIHYGAGDGTGHSWRFDGTNVEDYFRDGDNNIITTDLTTVSNGNNYFGVSTFDGFVHNCYIDNVLYLKLVDDYKGAGSRDFVIGDYDEISGLCFDGEIDEFWVYRNQMSRDWFNASYNNMNNKTAGASGFVILGDIEDYEAPSANTQPTVENHSIANGTVGVNWTFCNMTFTVNDTEGNTTYGNVTVMQNGTVTQTKNLGSFQNETLFIDMCKFNCSTEYIVHINVSDSGGLINNTWINFSSYTCNVSEEEPGATCNCSDIRTIIREELNTYNALKEDDTVELSVITAQFAIIINLLLFFFLFWIGYESKKRSGGAFLLISGFILIALEFSLVSYLNASYVVPFITPLAIFLMFLGGRKLLYKPSEEKHTPESQ